VYLPSCLTRTFAPAKAQPDQRPLNEVVASVLGKAGYEILYPQQMDGLCCGTPFKSRRGRCCANKLSELEAALLRAAEQWPLAGDCR
jgi:D-lactate dehydrogenase